MSMLINLLNIKLLPPPPAIKRKLGFSLNNCHFIFFRHKNTYLDMHCSRLGLLFPFI